RAVRPESVLMLGLCLRCTEAGTEEGEALIEQSTRQTGSHQAAIALALIRFLELVMTRGALGIHREGDLDELEAFARRGLASTPKGTRNVGVYYYVLGTIQAERHKKKEAEAILRDGLVADPRCYVLHQVLALLALDDGRNSEALDHLQAMARLEPRVAQP